MFTWFDRFWSTGDMLLHQQARGKFFVKYEDGNFSQNFDHKTAKDYAEIFGGEVFHISKKEEVREHGNGISKSA